MAMGVVSNEDFEKELNNSCVEIPKPATPPNATIIDIPSKGRQEGSTEVPDSLRKIIGETSVMEGRSSALELAAKLGISPSSVSAYARGATSTASYDKPKDSIINYLTNRKEKRSKQALEVMRRALSGISDDKLQNADAKELSGVAKDMAIVVKSMEPNDKSLNPEDKRPQFIVFAPVMRDESHFEVIHAKE